MSDIILSTNMNLPLPVVGLEPGPQYATDQNNAFTILDAHNHVPGSGVQIPSAGLNINADLPFNTHNATLLRSSRFVSNASPLTAVSPDIGCLYVSGADLYYNDTNGNQVRITSGGSVTGSSGTITGLPSGTASAAYSAGSGTFVFQQATSTAANIDGATLIVRYPGSYPSPAGNYIAIQAPASLSTGYSLTLPGTAPGSASALVTSSTAGVLSYTNVDNSTLQISSSLISVKNGGITGTQVANNINLPGTAVQAGSLNVITTAANAPTGLSIVRGEIQSGGTAQVGEGYTSSSGGTGIVNITFNTPFASAPVIVTSSTGNQSAICVAQFSSTTVNGCVISSYDAATQTFVNTHIAFIAIGPR